MATAFLKINNCFQQKQKKAHFDFFENIYFQK